MDKHIRLAMTGAGPKLLSVLRVQRRNDLRRVGNFYYERSFANAFVVAAAQSNASFSKIASIFASRCTQAGGELASMIPTRNRGFWHDVLEDIVDSPVLRRCVAQSLQQCFQRKEYT